MMMSVFHTTPVFWRTAILLLVGCAVFVCLPLTASAQLESPKNGGIDGGPGDEDEDDDKDEDDEDDETDLNRSKYEPSKMVARAIDAHSVTLTWSDNAKDEDGYQVYRMGPSGRWERIALIGRSSERFTDRTVTPGTSYTYRVRAYNRSSETGYSSGATVAVPPEDPTPLQAGADDVIDQRTATEEDVLDHLQKGDLTPEAVDDTTAEKTYECNVSMIPAKELEAYVAGECEAQIAEARQIIRKEFGDKLAAVEEKEKALPLWEQLYRSTTARVIGSALLLFIILNNVFWHMTHRNTRNQLRD